MRRQTPFTKILFIVLISLSMACEGDGTTSPEPDEKPSVEPSVEPTVSEPGVEPSASPESEPEAVVPTGCEGVLLEVDGALSFNTTSIALSGNVVATGATADPQLAGSTIYFVDTEAGATASVDVNDQGTYSLRLAPGQYQVKWLPPISCTEERNIPCTEVTIQEAITLAADGVLDVTLTSVKATISLTLDQGLFEAGQRGSITLQTADGKTHTQPIPTDGAAAERFRVSPGVYDVIYQPPTSSCQNLATRGLPCNGVVLGENLQITADGALDFDLKTVRASGVVKSNGADLDTGERGQLLFLRNGASASVALDNNGAAAYDLRLVPGTYQVYFSPPAVRCNPNSSLPNFPCHDVKVQQGLNLTSDGVLDIALTSIEVSGTVTVNGPGASDDFAGASVLFSSATKSVAVSVDDDGTYAVSLKPGAFDVSFQSGPCGFEELCGGQKVHSNVELTSDGVLDVSIDTLAISGVVLLEGETLAAHGVTNVSEAGYLVFSTSDASQNSFSTELTLAGYSLFVPIGTYDLSWSPGVFIEDGEMPQTGASVAQNIALTADGVLDVNLERFTLSYSLTHDGEALGNTHAGRLFFENLDDGGTTALIDNHEAGSLILSPGNYVVKRSALDPCSGDNLAACGAHLLFGCE